MKRFFSIIITLTLAFSLFAQKDVTTFLGIPVDGYKSEMRKKLIAKGFTPKQVSGQEYFEGEFNGAEVHVYIATNNNKVWRIMLCDVIEQDEANIKIRFNKLVRQFEKNKRYSTLKNYQIPEDENISYEMTINNKVYEAVYYQEPADTSKLDSIELEKKFIAELQKKGYTKEQVEKLPESKQNVLFADIFMEVFAAFTKKSVWFRISNDRYGKYYITMYYDNEYNHADGEDL